MVGQRGGVLAPLLALRPARPLRLWRRSSRRLWLIASASASATTRYGLAGVATSRPERLATAAKASINGPLLVAFSPSGR